MPLKKGVCMSRSLNRNMTRDLTEGSPMKLMIRFALPLLFGVLFQQFYSFVDTAIVGRYLGAARLAAVGATGSVNFLVIGLCLGLCSGMAIPIAQAFGAKDQRKIRQSIGHMMVLDGAITAFLTVLALVFLRPLMHLMNTPDTIFEQAHIYMAVIFGGMLATICYNMFAGILRAFGNSRTPLYFLIFSSLLNIALDLMFVAGFHMGVGGAALATVVAQAVSGILTGIYVYRQYRDMMPQRQDFRLQGRLTGEMLSTGGAMGFMYSVVSLGSVVFQGANNALGEAFIAAHTAARRIIGIMMQPLATLMDASSTFVGQNWGAGNRRRIRETLRKVLSMEVAWGLFSCLIVYVFGRSIIQFTTGTRSEDILNYAYLSLRIHFPFFPILGILLAMRVSMQSMGQKLAPVISSVIELFMKLLSAVWLIPTYGFVGTCVTEPVTWTIMTVFLMVVYFVRTRKMLTEATK